MQCLKGLVLFMSAYIQLTNPYNAICNYSYPYTVYKHLAMPNIQITLQSVQL